MTNVMRRPCMITGRDVIHVHLSRDPRKKLGTKSSGVSEAELSLQAFVATLAFFSFLFSLVSHKLSAFLQPYSFIGLVLLIRDIILNSSFINLKEDFKNTYQQTKERTLKSLSTR